MGQTITGQLVISSGGVEPGASLSLSSGGETASVQPGATITAEISAAAQGSGPFSGTIIGRVVNTAGAVLETLSPLSVEQPSGTTQNYLWSFAADSAWAGTSVQAQLSSDAGVNWTTAGTTVVIQPAAPAQMSWATTSGGYSFYPGANFGWPVTVTNVGGQVGAVGALPTAVSMLDGQGASWACTNATSGEFANDNPPGVVLAAGQAQEYWLISESWPVPGTAAPGDVGTFVITWPDGTTEQHPIVAE